MKNIDRVANAVLLIDKQLREELLIKDGTVQAKKLWENTYIKKQIDKRENGGTFTVSDHICAMVYSMLTSGASWSRVEPSLDIETGRIQLIDEIFCQYNVDTLLNTDPMILVDKVKAQTLGTQYIKNQMVALIGTNIGKMLSLENEYGSIDNFYQKFIDTDSTLKYVDRALTGTDDNRPNFQRMIEDSSTGLYERIVVYQFSRFCRNKEKSVIYKGMLKHKGIRVLSVNQYVDDGPTGVIVESIFEAMDEFYSLELSQKIKKGMDKNGEKCLCTGGNIALGFKVNKDKQFEIDPNTAPIVQTVFQMYADGKTVAEITTHLNSLGYKTSRGVPFNKNSLHTMLKNKRYIGIYTYKGQETPGGIPRIISDELFNRVSERMETNRKAPARARAKAEYLLTTKLFCGHCKQMMTGFSGKGHLGKRYNYYICNKRKLKNCEKKMVKKDYIENLVISMCRKFLSVKNIDKIAREVSAICQAERDTSNMRYLQKRLADSERKRENALNAILETDNTRLRENLYGKIAQLEAEQETLREELSKETAPFPSLTEPKIKFFLTALRNGSTNDVKYQRMLIKIFVNKIFLYDDRVTITFNAGNDTVEINERLLAELESNDDATKNLFIDGDGPPRERGYCLVFFLFNLKGLCDFASANK